jgi:hypothetical protein
MAIDVNALTGTRTSTRRILVEKVEQHQTSNKVAVMVVVEQRIELSLRFADIYYSEEFNNETSSPFITLSTAIKTQVMKLINF